MENNRLIEFKALGESSPIILLNRIEGVRSDGVSLMVYMESGHIFNIEFNSSKEAMSQKKKIAALLINKSVEEIETMKKN